MRQVPIPDLRSLVLRGPFLLLLVCLAACTPQNNQKATATPPPPKPAAAQPAPAEQQLSIPQTEVKLPSLQQVNPDAIPKSLPPAPATPASAPPERGDAAPPPKNMRRTAGATPKTETEAAPVQAPAEEAPPRFQPILNAEAQKRLQEAIEARRREIDERLRTAVRSSHDKGLIERIRSFVSLSEQAAKRGDYTQADALSERALILAKELQVE